MTFQNGSTLVQTAPKSSTGPQADPRECAAVLAALTPHRPKLAVVLGSGFASLTKALENATEVAYENLPGFLRPTAVGHRGRLVFGKLGGAYTVLLSGRSHYYEGHTLQAITFSVRVLAAYGIKTLLLTNAAGGINPAFRKGEFMALSDHINLMGDNPLRGTVPEGMERFVDMTQTYDVGLRQLLKQAAVETGQNLHEGVYLAVSGPSYETPAEIRAFARLGADAVGMSTVPEAIVARQCGLNIAAISCISNLAAGLGEPVLTPEDVLKTGEQVSDAAVRLISTFARLHGS